MHTIPGYSTVRLGGLLLVVLGCCTWGEANLEDFPNCNGDISSIGNSKCDPDNNNEACGWDGEDCCECTCVYNPEQDSSCDFFLCMDPNSGCAEPGLIENINCTGDVYFISDGLCDYGNNNEACGWDGNDCCECTCIDGYNYDCGAAGFLCLDTNSGCADPRFLGYSDCSGRVSWIGDAYCDFENNNEACGWDGGDCCECTCIDGENYDCASSEFFVRIWILVAPMPWFPNIKAAAEICCSSETDSVHQRTTTRLVAGTEATAASAHVRVNPARPT